MFMNIAPILRFIPLEASIAHCIDVCMYKRFSGREIASHGLCIQISNAATVMLSDKLQIVRTIFS